MTEEVLQHMERMLDFGSYARLGLLRLFPGPAERIFLQRLAHAAFHRDAPRHGFVRVLRVFVSALLPAVAEYRCLAPHAEACDSG